MRELDGRTQFEVRYGAKPGLAHLRAFGVPCAVVPPLEKLRSLIPGLGGVPPSATSMMETITRFGPAREGRRRVQRCRFQ